MRGGCPAKAAKAAAAGVLTTNAILFAKTLGQDFEIVERPEPNRERLARERHEPRTDSPS